MILQKVLERVPATLQQGSWETEIDSVAAHSKKVIHNSLFICIRGMETDGHFYIKEAIERGASACLVEERFWQDTAGQALKETLNENITILSVKDTREAAAWAAAAFYRYPSNDLKVIGITGTKGKTSVTFMIRDILEKAGYQVGLLGTIDYEIGHEKKAADRTTPEATDIQRYLRKMVDQGCQFAVMEVSSQGLKLHRADAIAFDVGVFTNLGSDHIGPKEHRDMAEYAACKSLLFQKCCLAIGNRDDAYFEKIFQNAGCPVQTYSCSPNRHKADSMASDVMFVNKEGKLSTFFKVNGEEYAVAAPGIFSVYNATAAIAVCGHYGVTPTVMREALRTVRVPGRMEVIDNDRGYLLLIDYAHNAMSLKNVLVTMRRYRPKRLWVLFGCGGGRSVARRKEMGRIAGKYADVTVITSDNPRYEAPEAIMQVIETGMKETNGTYRMITDRKQAMAFMLKNGRPGDILILAGKGHERYQETGSSYLPFDERVIAKALLQQIRNEECLTGGNGA